MSSFSDYRVWGLIDLMAVLFAGVLLANFLKRKIRLLRISLIPTSVLGGLIILLISVVYKAITGNYMFTTTFFGGNGDFMLETITYHSLALGFIAQTFKSVSMRFSRERTSEIFNTGVTTVATYLIQGVLGLAVTIIFAGMIKGLIGGAGILLPFGYGQGTGQALNWGGIYESDYDFTGGMNFGLTIAAMGFLSAAFGGVIHLNILRKKGIIKISEMGNETADTTTLAEIQHDGEIPMNGGLDKLSVQLAVIFSTYGIAYLIIYALGEAASGVKSILYGFNFLMGVLMATVVKALIALWKKKGWMHREYINSFMMERISGFFFDLMIVAGVAAIKIDLLAEYWYVIAILGIIGLCVTYFYNLFVAKKLFGDYAQEQFLAMFGMLTGTASTGIILLREIDPELKKPAAENLVYQNFPAIVFGFPMMLLAALAPKQPILTMLIMLAFFAVMNIILFRKQIFGKKKKDLGSK